MPKNRRLVESGSSMFSNYLTLLALFGLCFLAASSQPLPARASGNDPFTLDWSSVSNDETRSVAWGDVDGDGDLDLAAGNYNRPNLLYRNDGVVGGGLVLTPVWTSDEADATWSVAWGDMDSDGDLDLAVGNSGQPNRLYRNVGGTLTISAVWNTDESDNTMSIAWGDVDGDGDLDLAVGNEFQKNKLYRNEGGTLTTSYVWQSSAMDATYSVAWGDVDGDGDLDLATGNNGTRNKIYYNQGTMLATTAGWYAYEWDTTYSVAWGDVNGDGYPDLAAGNNFSGNNRLYINNHGVLPTTASWSSDEAEDTTSVAWGDYDSDGDLDLLSGNSGMPSQLYRNDNGVLTTSAVWSPVENDNALSVAWGDADGDGDLDLAVGNASRPNRVYRSEARTLTLHSVWGPVDAASANSVAWGDVDGDGDLDLAIGNGDYDEGQQNKLYRNIGGELTFDAVWSSSEAENTTSVAWGDVDGDGDLDLAAGNDRYYDYGCSCYVYRPNRLYRNVGGTLTSSAVWSSSEMDRTTSLAWGDVDGDGDLDLAIGNYGQPNRIYKGNEGMLSISAIWSSTEADNTYSVAWGDADGDGDLDLAVGNYNQPNRMYRNDGGTLTTSAVWSSANINYTTSVAWGDVDGDGALDLAAGNYGLQNLLYYNTAGVPAWASEEAEDTRSVAWGDVDGDGDLDLAVGNRGLYYSQPNRLYNNVGGRLNSSLTWTPVDVAWTNSVAWGDVDGDGDLDLAAGNLLYENTRDGRSLPGSIPTVHVLPPSLLANFYPDPRIWTGTIPITYALADPQGDAVQNIRAWYSPDGGGRWLEAVAAGGTQTSNLSTTPGGRVYTYYWDPYASGLFGQSDNVVFRIQAVPAVTNQPKRVAGPYLYGAYASTTSSFRARGTQVRVLPNVLKFDGSNDYVNVPDSNSLDLTNQMTLETWVNLKDPQADQKIIGKVLGSSGYLLGVQNGLLYPEIWDSTGARWYFQAGALPADTWTHLAVTWETGGKLIGYVNGQSVKIIQVSGNPIGVNTAALRIGKAPWGNDFRVNGQIDDVRVWNVVRTPAEIQRDMLRQLTGNENGLVAYWPFEEHSGNVAFDHTANQNDGSLGGGIASYRPDWVTDFQGGSVLVYRLPDGQENGAEPMGGFIQPFTTDLHGYLQGQGVLMNGDGLVALASIATSETYDLYHTSAAPLPGGLDLYPVTSSGVYSLPVSAENTLALFNLDISLQWDARSDAAYMDQLEYNLQRTSQLLYDWTDGQAALGEITIYQDREHWNDAHLRIYASNHQRPMALQGGIVSDLITDPTAPDIQYLPGQVHMGAAWSRYGETGANLAEDWPRALAHELGHWALYLNDNYLGVDAAGQVIPLSTCTGAMADPYRVDYPYDELHTDNNWLAECGSTLSHQATGRSDWATVKTFYPALNGPAEDLNTHTGPATLPLAVTQIEWIESITPTAALADPTFYLLQGGVPVQPGPTARAFLYQDGWGIDLGGPRLDRVLARGAKAGDRLCLYEPEAGRLGCKTIQALDNQQLSLAAKNWQPAITVTPVSTTTVNVELTGAILTETLKARLYPLAGPFLDEITLTWNGSAYAGSFTSTNPDVPLLEGYLQVWVDEPDPRRESLVDFAVGGNPARMRGTGARMRGTGARMRGVGAPLMAANGGVILFLDETQLGAEDLFTLQAASSLPYAPSWTTPVGAAYRLSASGDTAPLAQATIAFNYLGSEVPEGEESWLKLYYLAEGGTSWRLLPTVLDMGENLASAKVQGQGLYALMSSIGLYLESAGWNMISFPIQETRPVSEAMASISGYYTLVWGYKALDTLDPWKLYSPDVPVWVNDLQDLEFPHGYWIYATQPVTWYVKGNPPLSQIVGTSSAASMGGYPPAAFYGQLLPGPGFVPAPGTQIEAWVKGSLCGQGLTLKIGDQVVYTIDVLSDHSIGGAGCGVAGSPVRFRVGGSWTAAILAWDDTRAWRVDLSPLRWLFLPLVQR